MFAIETLRKQASDIAYRIEASTEDVEDTVAACRTRLRRKIKGLLSGADLSDLKRLAMAYPHLSDTDTGDFGAMKRAVRDALYLEHVALFESPEPITAAVVCREVATATANVARTRGTRFFHYDLLTHARAFCEKGDLASLTPLIGVMPELRKQVVELRANYAVTDMETGRVERFRDGFVEDVLVQLSCIDHCVEFLESERLRLHCEFQQAA